MAAPGRKVPEAVLVAVLSAAPAARHAAGTSWLGSPPAPLRRAAQATGDERTYAPPRRLKVARACWELRPGLPVALAVAPARSRWRRWHARRLDVVRRRGAALVARAAAARGRGVAAALVATVAKWVLVGRVALGDQPLWSSFVWRNELADNFVEVVAAPWFAGAGDGHAAAEPVAPGDGRAGRPRGVVRDLLAARARPGRARRRGDRQPGLRGADPPVPRPGARIDTVDAATGRTLGPNAVILPAATIGRHTTVGPVSLVMRGETVPDETRWIGNPIGPWAHVATRYRLRACPPLTLPPGSRRPVVRGRATTTWTWTTARRQPARGTPACRVVARARPPTRARPGAPPGRQGPVDGAAAQVAPSRRRVLLDLAHRAAGTGLTPRDPLRGHPAAGHRRALRASRAGRSSPTA